MASSSVSIPRDCSGPSWAPSSAPPQPPAPLCLRSPIELRSGALQPPNHFCASRAPRSPVSILSAQCSAGTWTLTPAVILPPLCLLLQ